MRREEYEEAKRNNPDWDKVVAEDIRSWSKLFVFDSVLAKTEYKVIMDKVSKRVESFTTLIDEEEIRKKYRSDLLENAEKLYKWAMEHLGRFTPHLISLALLKSPTAQQIKVIEKQSAFVVDLSNVADAMTITDGSSSHLGYTFAESGGMFYKDMQKLIKEELDRYVKLEVKPTYYANVNPRGMAEMAVRFSIYQKQKQELKDRGVKLVYVNAHSNCSKRCQPYQGRLYSLDGTSGTKDGKRYIPIEDAAENVTYTSERTGRTYYNGLFSYNCRHSMQEYEDGMRFEKIPDEVIEETRELEAHQRKMERDYRALREKEDLYRILGNRTKSREALAMATATRKKAAELRKSYVAFSQKHELPYNPSRLQILHGENRYVRTVGKHDPMAQAALELKNEA